MGKKTEGFLPVAGISAEMIGAMSEDHRQLAGAACALPEPGQLTPEVCEVDNRRDPRKANRITAFRNAAQPQPGTPRNAESESTTLALENAFPAPPAEDSAEGSSGPVLLLVEDEPDDFMLFKRAVEKAEVSAPLHWARNGSEAMAVLAQLGVEGNRVCLVLDIKLPDMDGFQLLQQVRSSPWADQVIVVFLTGNRHPALEKRAYASGAQAYFVKSCRSADLVDVVRAFGQLLHSSHG